MDVARFISLRLAGKLLVLSYYVVTLNFSIARLLDVLHGIVVLAVGLLQELVDALEFTVWHVGSHLLEISGQISCCSDSFTLFIDLTLLDRVNLVKNLSISDAFNRC